MKFNDTDLSKYGAKQYRITFEQSAVENGTEWLRAPLPIWDSNYRQQKEITVEVLVYGSSREEIRNNISNIAALCMDPVEIELDGYERMFKGILKSASVDEGSDVARERYQHYKMEFDAYEHGAEIITEGSGATITVENPGNVFSPAILEITPTIGISSLTIDGICRDSISGEALTVTVGSLTTGNTVKLDGVDGLITEAGALKEVDMWALPTLLPGTNTITFSSSRLTVKVTVLPLYM